MKKRLCTDCNAWVEIKSERSWGAHIIKQAHRRAVNIRLGLIRPKK